MVAAGSGGDSELKLGLDLLRNGSELVLVESDVGSVEGLENDVAREGSGLGRVAVQHEDVLVRTRFTRI